MYVPANFRAVALPLLIVCGVRAQLPSPGIKVGTASPTM